MNLHSTARKPNRLARSLLSIPILIMLLVSGSSCVSKGTYEKLATERSSVQGELTTAKASLSSITTERDKLNSELTATKAGLSSITAQRDSLNSQLATANTNLSSMTAERDKLSSQLTSTNASLSSMTADRDKLTSQLATANANLSALTAERDSLNGQLTATKASLSTLTAERDKLNSELTAAKVSLSSITAERDKLNTELNATKASLSALTAERDRLSFQIAQLNVQVAQLNKMMTPSPDHAMRQSDIYLGNPDLMSVTWRGRKVELLQKVASIGRQYYATHTYIPNETDCTDMAVDLWNMLFTQGIKSVIVVGNLEKSGATFLESDHTWILGFDAEGYSYALEPTTGEVIYYWKAEGIVNPEAVPYYNYIDGGGFLYKKPSDLWSDLKKKW